MALTTHHLAPRLNKEYSYTSTPPLGLRGLLQGELYLYHFPEDGQCRSKHVAGVSYVYKTITLIVVQLLEYTLRNVKYADKLRDYQFLKTGTPRCEITLKGAVR